MTDNQPRLFTAKEIVRLTGALGEEVSLRVIQKWLGMGLIREAETGQQGKERLFNWDQAHCIMLIARLRGVGIPLGQAGDWANQILDWPGDDMIHPLDDPEAKIRFALVWQRAKTPLPFATIFGVAEYLNSAIQPLVFAPSIIDMIGVQFVFNAGRIMLEGGKEADELSAAIDKFKAAFEAREEDA